MAYPPAYYDNDADEIYGLKLNVPGETWGEYTLISNMGFNLNECTGLPGAPEPGFGGKSYCGALLIDMEGNLVNGWGTTMLGVPAKMLPNGDVMLGQDGFFEGMLTQVSWTGERLNQWGPMHHDHQREGNPVGYYAPGLPALSSGITMRMERESASDPEISDYTLEDDLIIQEEWDGTEIWRWTAREHFFPDEETGNLGFGLDANALIAIKEGPFINGLEGNHDYTHANCASWLGPNPWFNKKYRHRRHGRHYGKHCEKDYRFHPDNIIADFRSMNVLFIIARHDHPDGLWKEGAIVWRVGPDFSAKMPEHKIGQIIGPHHTHMIPRGLPGAGNILVFDNGGSAGFGSYFPGMTDGVGGPIGTYPNTFRSYSRIIEFDPITLDVVWEYLQPNTTADLDGDGKTIGNERKFFASHYSSAQRLKNGNTLITEGNSGRIFEVTTENEIVWEYVNQPGNFFYFGDYRAYRIPGSWVFPHLSPEIEAED